MCKIKINTATQDLQYLRNHISILQTQVYSVIPITYSGPNDENGTPNTIMGVQTE